MKKTLALVLALVMVIGMMAVPASAAYTDAADIQYTEAVDVMSAIGVIEGYNNEFNPKGELTRAAGAKLVAYLELGATAAEALTAEKAVFADVPADHWAAGYIGWAASKGYINGVGNNSFAPDAPLTALAYAKLMLCALGYDAAVEGFTGEGWEYNVMELALEADIFDGNDEADMAAVATREEAALYSFNALKADMVKYESKGTKVEINGAVIATGASAAEVVLSDADYADNMLDAANDEGMYKVQLAEKRYSKLEKVDSDADAFGRPAVEWEYDGNDVGTYADDAAVVYTASVKAAAVKADLSGIKVGGTKVNVISEDGRTVSSIVFDNSASAGTLTIGADKCAADAIAALTANGRAVEVYVSDKAVTAIVLVDTYVGTIDAWTKADADKSVDENVTVVPVGDVDVDGNDKGIGYFKTTAFDEADEDDATVVLFTAADAVIKSVVAAESVTAFVEETTVNSSDAVTNFVADGKAYKTSANNEGTFAYVKDGDDTVIYLDSYGYAIYSDAPEGADNEYAYVLGVANDAATAMFNDVTYYAELLLPTGEKITVEIDDEDSTAGEGEVATYTVDDDGVYTIETYELAEYSEEVAIDNGKSAATLAGDVNNINTKTIVVVEEEKDEKTVYVAYTGYKAVPTLDTYAGDEDITTAVAVVPVTTKNDDGETVATATAKIVFVLGATKDESVDSKDLTFVAAASQSKLITNASGSYYTYNALVEGEAAVLKFSVDAAALIDADTVIKSVTTNSKGIITAFVEADDVDTALSTGKEDGGQIELGDAKFNYDEDTVVYTVDKDGVIAASSISAVKNDDSAYVTFVVDDDNAELLVAAYIFYDYEAAE